mgnify:CR=1 FL=1
MTSRPDRTIGLVVFVLATVIPALAFLRFPLNGSLYGSIDIWFYVWQMEELFLGLAGTGGEGHVLHPGEHLTSIQESPYGIGALYLPARAWIENPIVVLFLLTHVVLGLNALALFSLGRRLRIAPLVMAPVAIAFAFNNFAWSNVENFNAYALFPSLFAAASILATRGARPGKRMFLWVAAGLWFGVQLHFSIYFFAFQLVLIPALVVMYRGILNDACPSLRDLTAFTVGASVCIVPFLLTHLHAPTHLQDPEILWSMVQSNEAHSISLFKDYLRADPGNLILSPWDDISNPWRSAARSGFFGFLTYAMLPVAVVILLRDRPGHALGLLATLVLFMGLSTGPSMHIGEREVLTPIGLLNEHVPRSALFRHFFRAHLVVIALSLLVIASALSALRTGCMHRWAGRVAILFAVVFCVENLPWTMPTFEQHGMLEPPLALRSVEARHPIANVLILPSCHRPSGEDELGPGVNAINREFIAMVWKTRLDMNLYNGQLSYVPDITMRNTYHTCDLTASSLTWLVNNNDIDAFVVLPHIALPGEMDLIEEAFRGWTPDIAQDGLVYWVDERFRSSAKDTVRTPTSN